jgi:hypothetical protein
MPLSKEIHFLYNNNIYIIEYIDKFYNIFILNEEEKIEKLTYKEIKNYLLNNFFI